MSDTPITDAACSVIDLSLEGYPPRTHKALCELSECSRTLERENTRLRAALRAIADYDEQPIWMDSRDDAADNLLELAREALKEQPEKS